MTTIAYDGKTLAADTCWQSCYNHQHDTTKIKRKGGVAWGSAGEAQSGVLFDRWVEAGRPEDKKPKISENDFSALVIEESGDPVIYNSELVPLPAGTPSATGSGCCEAMGAMMAGATAKKAVEIAIILDSGTGGRVRTFNCGAKKK